MRKTITVILYAMLLISCGKYEDKEVINRGKSYTNKYKGKLERVMMACDTTFKDTCEMYNIHFSRKTDAFSISRFYYDSSAADVFQGDFLTMSDEQKQMIRDSLKQDFSEFAFAPHIYYAFELSHLRTYSSKYAKLIYFKDKETLKILFPDYSLIDSTSQEIPKERWIYLYDNHWGVTASSMYFHKTKRECMKGINK